ncbi:MAG: hypothetical protein MK116_10240 [Phycisphaerales bacterium]|nr:hypothetical protein [Phycisphaerales bacterium]
MWLWRLVHGLRVNFPFLLLGVLILEGVVALLSMFTFPPLALALVFVGLGTLALSIVARGMLAVADTSLARFLGIEIPPTEGEEPEGP